MSSPSACFSSSSRSMRSINDFSCAPAIPPTSGIIPSPPVVMLPPQQGGTIAFAPGWHKGAKPIYLNLSRFGVPERRGPVVLVRDRGFRHARPTATAPHPYSTLEPRHERAQRPHDDRGGRGRVVQVHIARDGIGLADRAIETRES